MGCPIVDVVSARHAYAGWPEAWSKQKGGGAYAQTAAGEILH